MAMQTRCAGTARAPGRALRPSVCSGVPALGLRRAEPGARSGPGRRARGLVGRERGALPSLPPSSGAAFRFPRSSLPVGASAPLSCKELFQNFSRSLSRTKLSFPRSESASRRQAPASDTARVSEATPACPPARGHGSQRRGDVSHSALPSGARGGPVQLRASVREAPQGHTLSSARAGYDLGTRNSEMSNVGVFCRVTEQTTAELKRGEAPRQGAGPGDRFLREKRTERALLKTRLLLLAGMTCGPAGDADDTHHRAHARPWDPEVAHEHIFFAASEGVRETRGTLGKLFTTQRPR